MTDYATNVARDDQSWVWLARIDGLGQPLTAAELALADGDARIRFCTALTAYSAAMPASVWEDLLSQIPSVLTEKVSDLGGATELGGLTLEIVDEGDLLTGLIRTERPPTTRLAADVTGTTVTSFTMEDTSPFAVDDLFWMGGEALRVTSVSMSAVGVARGALGTDPTVHAAGAEAFLSITFLRGRRITLHIVPLDGDSSADERELGTFVIDSLAWSDDLNRWILEASSQLKPLARQIPLEPRQIQIARVRDGDPKGQVGVVLDIRNTPDFRVWTNSDPDLFYFRHENGEVLTFEGDANGFVGSNLRTYRRDLLRTGAAELKVDDKLSQVFLAEYDGPGSFRYSPGPSPSTNRSTGTWEPTAHWIPLMAILLTSSAKEGDGLELLNYVAARGNFSSLPPGFGVGYPAALIDWDTWFDLWDRTPDYIFPNFVFGDEFTTFGELVTENFLRPMGAYFITAASLARIVMPRLPLVGSSVFTIGPENILTRRVGGKRQYLIDADVRRDKSTQSSAIRYIVGPARGQPVTFHSAEFGATYGQGGYYGSDEKPIEITVPGGDPDTPEIYARRGLSRLWRTRRPRIEVNGSFDASVWDGLPLGEVGALTLDELPDLSRGLRGWDAIQVQHLEAEPRGDTGSPGGFYTRSRMLGYGPDVRVGRIAASAIIAPGGVSGDVATVITNRYTHSDARNNLPTEDAATFHLDDEVRLLNLDGTDAGGGLTQTVISVSGDDVELDGDFGGALAAGLVLVYADYDDAASQQQQAYAFMSDTATLTVGASSDDAWIYGEI